MAKKRVLIVDDSNTILLMERMLLSKNYDVISAQDGEDAVAKATKNLPDLILLDVMMPKMDGFQACKLLKSMEKTQNIPVIMVTTRGEENNIETGYQNGCNDYVTKPINSLELMSKMKTFLGE